MNIILLEKVRNLGSLGDTVDVKPGFARNFLLPQGKAVRATKINIEQFEARRAELEKKAADILTEAEQRAEKLNELSIQIAVLTSDEGKLYGSVAPHDIADAIHNAGVPVLRSEISMPEGPIHSIGEYDISVLLHSDVTAQVKVVVVSSK
jgi:large subunit ribosomal protein L9